MECVYSSSSTPSISNAPDKICPDDKDETAPASTLGEVSHAISQESFVIAFLGTRASSSCAAVALNMARRINLETEWREIKKKTQLVTIKKTKMNLFHAKMNLAVLYTSLCVVVNSLLVACDATSTTGRFKEKLPTSIPSGPSSAYFYRSIITYT